MTTPMIDAVAAAATDQTRRDQQKDNSAQISVFNYEHRTSGSGQTVMAAPVRFNVDFTEAPRMTSGVILDRLPDLDLWQYPLVTAGVARWVLRNADGSTTTTNQTARKGSVSSVGPALGVVNRPPFYVGAFLFFVVRCDPIYTQRTDGANVASLQAKVDRLQPGTTEYKTAAQALKEAKFAKRLTAEPPQVTVRHTLRFEALALKTPMKLAAKSDADVVTRGLSSR